MLIQNLNIAKWLTKIAVFSKHFETLDFFLKLFKHNFERLWLFAELFENVVPNSSYLKQYRQS